MKNSNFSKGKKIDQEKQQLAHRLPYMFYSQESRKEIEHVLCYLFHMCTMKNLKVKKGTQVYISQKSHQRQITLPPVSYWREKQLQIEEVFPSRIYSFLGKSVSPAFSYVWPAHTSQKSLVSSLRYSLTPSKTNINKSFRCVVSCKKKHFYQSLNRSI